MQKIAINSCYGGFHLSYLAHKRYAELAGREFYAFVHTCQNDEFIPFELKEGEAEPTLLRYFDIPNANRSSARNHSLNLCVSVKRNDPILIQVIEELGEKASGRFGKIKIVEIPDGINWEIKDYDGMESVEEVHLSWG